MDNNASVPRRQATPAWDDHPAIGESAGSHSKKIKFHLPLGFIS